MISTLRPGKSVVVTSFAAKFYLLLPAILLCICNSLSASVKPADAFLAGLTINTGALSPAFAQDTYIYTITVSNATSSVSITATTDDPAASVTINAQPATSGVASAPINIIPGDNNISVVVNSADGTFQHSYSVKVHRIANNAYLSNISLSSGTLSPAFTSTTGTYTTVVGNDVTYDLLGAFLNNPYASLTVNGAATTSGQVKLIPLVVGDNLVTMVVTAEDGVTHKTYKLTITRVSSTSDSYLASLDITNVRPINFQQQNTDYSTITTTSSPLPVTVTPTTSNPGSTIKVNGTPIASGATSAPVLVPGTITIVVTPPNGINIKTYRVVVARLSNNAYLSNITPDNGVLSPVFYQTIANYTDTVGNSINAIILTPQANSPSSTITVNGVAVASGSPSPLIPLTVGTNTIVTFVVTAQDSMTHKTYKVSVFRPSNNPYLSNLTLSSGTLSPAFAMGSGTYTASVGNSTTSVTVTPTLNNPHGSVKVNGTTVTSGTASADIPLSVGDNAITTVVTAQDGTTHKTYTVTVNRAMGSLNSLYLPGSNERTSFVTSLGEKVEANNILSPNGDGINDIWVVKNIAFFPDNVVSIYDREGKIVFTQKGYTNNWDGSYRGSAVKEGIYYYSINLGDGTIKKGYITVVGH